MQIKDYIAQRGFYTTFCSQLTQLEALNHYTLIDYCNSIAFICSPVKRLNLSSRLRMEIDCIRLRQLNVGLIVTSACHVSQDVLAHVDYILHIDY